MTNYLDAKSAISTCESYVDNSISSVSNINVTDVSLNSILSSKTIDDSGLSDCATSSKTITINSNDISSNWWTTTGGTSIGTISPSYDYVTVSGTLNGYLSNNEAKIQFSILERYFKMGFVKSNKYDKELTKSEFLDLVTLYINRLTKRDDCKVSFDKDIMLETLTFNIDRSTSFTLDNDKDLLPETYLYFMDKFYVNTENLLAILKKATFNRLLDVQV